AAADHHELAVAVTERGERLDTGDQPRATEADPHEERGPCRGAEANLFPHGGAGSPVARVKALEIDAVVDHADLFARHAVQRLDLTLPAPSDRGNGRCAHEDPSLEGEHQPMIEPARAAPSCGQVSAMASPTRAIDLLAERSLGALPEIPSAPTH